MTNKLSKNKALFLIGLGVFLILGGVFGVYMQASGSDNNAYFSASVMLIFGILFLFFGSYNLKK